MLSHPSRLIAVNTTLRNDLGKSYEGLGFLAHPEKMCRNAQGLWHIVCPKEDKSLLPPREKDKCNQVATKWLSGFPKEWVHTEGSVSMTAARLGVHP